jgi:menaquinol-cytochrome c reductase cytochrome b/c subunit
MAVAAPASRLPSVAVKPRRDREEEVLVWPDLVFAEFVSALVFTATMLALSWAINAPLLDRANSDFTPNPSKAPWYFLNLQELLLHMHPALAGVVVPTVALLLLAVIPYIDRRNEGQGVWWGTKNAKRIAVFATVYATLVTILLVLVDKFETTTPRRLQTDVPWPDWTSNIWTPLPGISTGGIDFAHWNIFDPNANSTNLAVNFPAWLVEQAIPIACMAIAPVILVYLIRPMGRSMRDAMIALFTGFMACWLTLTLIGTGFRGEAMELLPPWEVGGAEE